MKITYIHQHFRFPEEPGGTRSWEFARRLAEEGHEVTVLCAGDSGSDQTRNKVRVIRSLIKYDNRMGVTRRMTSFLGFALSATVRASSLNADVVLASSTPLTVVLPGAVAATVRRARFVVEVRDLWPDVPLKLGFLPPFLGPLARLLERFAYARADEVIALSPGMAEGVLAVDPQVPVTVVPNCSDVDRFDLGAETRAAFRVERGWRDDETVLLYAGSLGRTYNVEWLVRFAGALRGVPIRVLIAGDGATRWANERLARDLGLNPQELFIGQVPKQEMPKYMAAADATMSSMIDHPALYPNSYNKVFDSLAASRPVIFNHPGWLSELVSEAGAGWSVPDRQPDQAARDLLPLLSDRTLLDAAGLAAGCLAREQFDRDVLYKPFAAALLGAKMDQETEPRS